MISYPGVVAFDTDFTIFSGSLDQGKWGKGPGAFSPPEDNIVLQDGSETILVDRSNRNQRVVMSGDVPRIINDVIANGAKLALVAKNPWKAGSDRALYWLKAVDPRDNQKKGIIFMVDYDEIGEKPGIHMERIQEWSGVEFADMVFFDSIITNDLVQIEKGVVFQHCPGQQGINWETYQQGIDQWRRLSQIRHPYLGQNLSSYQDPMFIGYSGMDENTVNLLTQGKHRVDLKESARWGHAMYVADDIRVANFFAEWIKNDAFGQNAKTYVCEIWVRDKSKFLATNKVWWPEEWWTWQNDVHKQSREKIAMDQEKRDQQSTVWGAPPPYILFSRHFWMDDMPIPRTRWNEMVIYTHVQQALVLTIPLDDQQLRDKLTNYPQPQPFDKQVGNWNIKMSPDAATEFRRKSETYV